MFETLFKYSRADYARSELIFAGEWPLLLIAGLALLAVVSIVVMLVWRRGNASVFQLATIATLQIAMVAVVLALLMQPTLTTERLRDGDNAIALVVDNSASMAYGAPASRFSEALSALSGIVPDGGADSGDFSIRHYAFSDTARPLDSFSGVTAEGNATAIADALRVILSEAQFSSLAAVVLSSDGADTSGGLTAEQLAELAAFGIPVHTISVGQSSIPEDIELEELAIPEKALPGSTIVARVTVRHDAPGTAQVKVYDDDELLQIVPLALAADVTTTTSFIEVDLQKAGPHQLRFTVEGEDAEPESRNNSRARLVNVASEKYRILYFEGEPRWEYKFLRRAVNNDEDLSIATLLRVSPNKFYRQGIDSPEQLEDGFPTDRNTLFAYNALIIGSVEAASLSAAQQSLIRDFVSERGGSLLMLAGPNGLGNGGWGQSAIADVLPARLPPSSADSFHRRKADVSLTPQGAGSQLLRFAAESADNRAAWLELPQIADYQLVGNLKPATITLLNVDTGEGLLPLLMTQPFGRGHAWILASGGTWRWQMSMPLEDQKHETFWRQLLRELVASAPQTISLTASATGGNAAMQLRAEFRDEAFQPMNDVGVTLIASHDNGESVTLSMQPDEREAGVFGARLLPAESGTWYFEAVAERDGEPVAVARSSMLHESGQSEHFGFRSNPDLLRRISEATGGGYFTPENLAALPDMLRYSSSGITETEYRRIWDAPAFFLLLLLLKSGEWLLRRRWSSV